MRRSHLSYTDKHREAAFRVSLEPGLLLSAIAAALTSVLVASGLLAGRGGAGPLRIAGQASCLAVSLAILTIITFRQCWGLLQHWHWERLVLAFFLIIEFQVHCSVAMIGSDCNVSSHAILLASHSFLMIYVGLCVPLRSCVSWALPLAAAAATAVRAAGNGPEHKGAAWAGVAAFLPLGLLFLRASRLQERLSRIGWEQSRVDIEAPKPEAFVALVPGSPACGLQDPADALGPQDEPSSRQVSAESAPAGCPGAQQGSADCEQPHRAEALKTGSSGRSWRAYRHGTHKGTGSQRSSRSQDSRHTGSSLSDACGAWPEGPLAAGGGQVGPEHSQASGGLVACPEEDMQVTDGPEEPNRCSSRTSSKGSGSLLLSEASLAYSCSVFTSMTGPASGWATGQEDELVQARQNMAELARLRGVAQQLDSAQARLAASRCVADTLGAAALVAVKGAVLAERERSARAADFEHQRMVSRLKDERYKARIMAAQGARPAQEVDRTLTEDSTVASEAVQRGSADGASQSSSSEGAATPSRASCSWGSNLPLVAEEGGGSAAASSSGQPAQASGPHRSEAGSPGAVGRFDGYWRLEAMSEEMEHAPRPWLWLLRIQGDSVVDGEQRTGRLTYADGEVLFEGGTLYLFGNRLIRVGKSGAHLQYVREPTLDHPEQPAQASRTRTHEDLDILISEMESGGLP